MSERVEFFDHVFCFTPIWGFVDLLLIFHFCFSWYQSFKKTGWKIDFWYCSLFFSVFQSLLILYPFNASIYNIPATIGFYDQILPFIDKAFFISVLGYNCLWLGRYLFDMTQGRFPFSIIFQWAKPLTKMIENNIKSQQAYFVLVIGTFVLGGLILGLQFKEGHFFSGREWFLQQPMLRPLFNLTISIFPVALSIFSLRYIQFKERRCLGLIITFLLFTVFFGVRSVGLGVILFFITQKVFYREGRFSLIKLFSVCFSLLVCAIILGDLREGRFNPLDSFFETSFKVFYGNNFSDTRDFAWILALWDGEYLYGKTYIAALISFIPRFLSPLREEWGFPMYTNGLIGFDSEIMPGLRPGMFGEPFFNFSYLGVVLFGLLFGFSLRYVDLKIKESVKNSRDIIKGYSYTIIMSLISFLGLSVGMWGFYTLILLHLAMWLVRGMSTRKYLAKSI